MMIVSRKKREKILNCCNNIASTIDMDVPIENYKEAIDSLCTIIEVLFGSITCLQFMNKRISYYKKKINAIEREESRDVEFK